MLKVCHRHRFELISYVLILEHIIKLSLRTCGCSMAQETSAADMLKPQNNSIHLMSPFRHCKPLQRKKNICLLQDFIRVFRSSLLFDSGNQIGNGQTYYSFRIAKPQVLQRGHWWPLRAPRHLDGSRAGHHGPSFACSGYKE